MFKLQNTKKIPLLRVNAQVFQHSQFGCTHLHLDCDSTEKAFSVAFRTIPKDHSGIAHILEHTVLCGSEKFPVRDPFFMMTRRSLSTFMNAMTYPDITAYPFATLNDKDFGNLLSVYLDAAFFPNIDELDFMQEGHRFELIKDGDGEKLTLKGVVYNEMKGAMSSVPRQLWHGVSKSLYPTTTYGFNSGGDPDFIPDLTYSDLKNFHNKYYHPSNAVFFSYGNLDAKELQQELENAVLSKFTPQNDTFRVISEPIFDTEKYSHSFYNPLPDDQDNHHVVVAWLLNSTKNPVDHLEACLLENILLDNSSSPLRKALESTDLGKAPSPITFMETEQKQMAFVAGLEGVTKDKEKEVETLIIDVFKDLVSNGIEKDLIKASLHQIEISQREISGGMPYGLQLLLGTMPSILHDSDPLEVLDLEGSLSKLRKRLDEPNHLEKLIEKFFLKNKHRVTFQLIPNTNYDKDKLIKLEKLLSEKIGSLSNLEKESIRDLTAQLETRQNSKDDPSLLPCVTVADIEKERFYTSGYKHEDDNKIKYFYHAGTNGIDYTTKVFAMEPAKLNDLRYSNFFSDVITNVGVGKKDYEKIQKEQSLNTGGIGLSFNVLPDGSDDRFFLSAGLHGSSLGENFQKLQNLMNETIQEFRLDEIKRLEELTQFEIAGKEKSITQSGHILAMNSASAQISKFGAVSEFVGGVSSIHNLKALRDANGKIKIDELLGSFAKLKKSIDPVSKLEVVISANDLGIGKQTTTKSGLETLNGLNSIDLQSEEVAWITGSDVNFCAQAFPTVDYDHPDAPILTVLGAVLRNGYLHSAIREKGGAYGSGAQQDSASRSFRFFSYRDPNCKETFDAFNGSIEWSLKSINSEKLEEGILGVISSIDKPGSPAGEARADFNQNIRGVDQAKRKRFRSRVIGCSVERLVEVSQKYLTGTPKRAVISGKQFEKEINTLGLSIHSV